VTCHTPKSAAEGKSSASANRITRCPTRVRNAEQAGHRPNNPNSCAHALMAAGAATKQPAGQIVAFAVGQIRFRTPGILSPRKGRWPSSRTLGWDAVDAAASCARWDGRAAFRARERSQDVRTSGAEAYGEVVWSWRLSGWHQVCEKASRPDRADEPAICRRRRQQSPILRGEREVSRKAIAQGMPECLR
jgi:hypothetical protein